MMNTRKQLRLSDMRPWLDAIPLSVFLVDAERRIQDANATARETFSSGGDGAGNELIGERLQCDRGLAAPNGCGSTEACRECAVRHSVCEALQGRPVRRELAVMKIRRGRLPVRLHILISGTPVELESRTFALLTLEDVTGFVDLHSILPVCSQCRRVRNDRAAWEKLEAYLNEHFDIRFSHSICPECCDKLYGPRAP